MAMVEVPDELLEALAQSELRQCEAKRRPSIAVAIALHQSNQIAGTRAAQLAGVPYVDYLDILSRLGLPAVTYGVEEYEEDVRTLKRIRESRAAE